MLVRARVVGEPPLRGAQMRLEREREPGADPSQHRSGRADEDPEGDEAQKSPGQLNVTWTKVTDESLKLIGQHCPNLNRLNVSGCWDDETEEGVTDDGITAIARNCPSLNQLNVLACQSVTDVGITSIATNCPNMKSLDVSFTKVTAKCVTDLKEKYPEIELIRMGR